MMKLELEEAKPLLPLEDVVRVCAAAGDSMKREVAGAASSGVVHSLAILIAAALQDLGRVSLDAGCEEILIAAREQLRAAVDLLEPLGREPKPVENGVQWLHGVDELSRHPDVRLDIPAEHFAAAADMAGLDLVDGEEPLPGHYPAIIAHDASIILHLFNAEHRSGLVFDDTEKLVVAVRLEVVDLPDHYADNVLPSYFLEFGRSVEQA